MAQMAIRLFMPPLPLPCTLIILLARQIGSRHLQPRFATATLANAKRGFRKLLDELADNATFRAGGVEAADWSQT